MRNFQKDDFIWFKVAVYRGNKKTGRSEAGVNSAKCRGMCNYARIGYIVTMQHDANSQQRHVYCSRATRKDVVSIVSLLCRDWRKCGEASEWAKAKMNLDA